MQRTARATARRFLLGLSVTLMLAGCGQSQLTAARALGPALQPKAAAAPLAGRAVIGAVALSARHLVAASVSAASAVNSFDPADGEISVSRTGGRSWRVTLRLPRHGFSWIGRAGRDLIAIERKVRDTPGGGSEETTPLLWVSANAGESWEVIHPRGRSVFSLVNSDLYGSRHGVLLAVPSLDGYPASRLENPGPYGVLRSVDGGRTWQQVGLPGGGTAFGDASWVGGSTVFVSGYADHAGCRFLWRSTNAGRSFRGVPGGCNVGRGQTLGGNGVVVDFLTARDGFVAGGGIPIGGVGQWLYATSDGGRHWHLRWHDVVQYGETEIADLDFVNPRDGWAVPGGAATGASFAYLGAVLHTSDGGRTWIDTGQVGSGVSALADGSTALSYADPLTASGSSDLSLSRDGGDRWTELSVGSVQTDGLLGGGGWILDETSAGDFLSTDGAVRWRDLPLRDVYATPEAVFPGRFVDSDLRTRRCDLAISVNGRSGWHTVPQPGDHEIDDPGSLVSGGSSLGCEFGTPDFAFASRRSGVALPGEGFCGGASSPPDVYETRDGGIRWRRARQVPGSEGSVTALTASPAALLVVASTYGRSGCNVAAVSTDGGAHWRVTHLHRECDGASALGRQLWLACGGVVDISHDTGRRWTVRRGPDQFNAQQIVATGANSAVVSSGDLDELGPERGTQLWRTADDGRSWTRFLPRLPLGPRYPPNASYLPGGGRVG